MGIGTTTPNQELDVNGKIKIGNDARTPTNGTIGYINNDFQGFVNGEYKSLTSSSNIPSNAQLVVCRVASLPTDSSTNPMAFRNESGTLVVNTTVPANKFLLITHIEFIPASLFDFDTEIPFYSLKVTFGAAFQNQLNITGKYTGGTLYQNTAGYSPIGVVPNGQSLTIQNLNLSSGFEKFDQGIDVFITGFLVDDLKFD